MKVALSFLCALLPLLLAGCGGGGTALSVWERFEATLDVPVTGDNPFDSAQADLTGEFVSPSGETYSVSGFASRDYERELVDGTEKLTPAGDLRWTLRFTPTEAGEWRWRWSMTTPAGTQAGDWQSFDVSAAKHDRHGFLRVSPDDSRYLRFDDGAPYFAVGENLAWYDQRGTFAYDDWLSKLAAQGVNYVRLWMPSWAFGLEWTDPNTLGNYAERLDRAWQLDYVLEQAERHGIYVMLSIQNHGAFSLATNSEWDGSPYNAANGGPLARPVEFFTNDEAKTLFKRRLRYIVARWGYSPSVLAWELWNEVDNTELPETDAVVAWHQEMAQELRALDPYAHLISTSTGLEWAAAVFGGQDPIDIDVPPFQLWELPEIDFAQAHLYSVGSAPLDFSALLPRISERLRRFGKPALIAEAGVDFRGPSETLDIDPEGDGFHDMLWAGLFAEAFGTGMSWWWDNVIDPQDWYFHFGPVASIVDGIAFDREGFRSGGAMAEAPGQDLRAYSLIGETAALVWVKNAAHQWYAPDRAQIEDATLTVGIPSSGKWVATWLDTYTGRITQSRELDVRIGLGLPGGDKLPARKLLDIPPFSRDIALRLDRSDQQRVLP